VVIITGFVGEMPRLNAFEAGADDFLTKPFSPRHLVAKVADALRLSERRNQRAATNTAS
jgi:two-component system phosphate regulon response regulator PhoB